MSNLPVPIFFSTDPGQIIAEMKAFYEAATSKILQPAQPEMLLINTLAYREALNNNRANEACKQNLLQYSAAPILDYLAELLGVTRIQAQPAICNIEFTLTTGHGAGVLPAGLRVSTTDGNYVFTIDSPTSYLSTDTSVIAPCTSQQTGFLGNGFIAGTVTVLLDPLAAVATGSNVDTTSGGTDDETDDSLRERIRIAPNSFSTAGSIGSYIYATKTADISIIDVSITSSQPGFVEIWPLVAGGIVTSGAILAKVELACNPEDVRPLNDTVFAYAPTIQNYQIQVDLTIYEDADQTATQMAVQSLIDAFVLKVQSTLGLDILSNKIEGLSTSNVGVYDAVITLSQQYPSLGGIYLPTPAIILDDTQFGVCTATTVNVIGLSNG